MSNKGRKSLSVILAEVKEFIRFVFETPDDNSFPPNFEVFFSITEEGFIGLNGEPAKRYRQCLRNLIETVPAEHISSKIVEQHLQRALLFALDISQRRQDQPLETRLDRAIKELRKALEAKPILFRISYPVENLSVSGLPIKFGNVQFCIFDVGLRNDTLSQMKQFLAEPSQGFIDHSEMLLSKLLDRVVGVVEVRAIESEAATVLAKQQIQLTIDAINFFSSLRNWPAWVYLPGDGMSTTIGYVASKIKEVGTAIGLTAVGPLEPLPLDKLHEVDRQDNIGLAAASQILASGNRVSEFQEVLLSAIRWAGKARVGNRNEESFLSYAIALESLILAEIENTELQYRLITRIAHLYGTDLASRKEILADMKRLYQLRSSIVHSGKIEVTDAEMQLMRRITQACIQKVLTDKAFANIRTIQDWKGWFDDRILA